MYKRQALITNWDGQWYERIATLGYHLPEPGTAGAKDALWTYAFLPVFPTVMGAMMAVTGLSFAVCATIVNLAAGAAAMVVMFALVERPAGRFAAGAAGVFTCCFMTAPLFPAADSRTALELAGTRAFGNGVVLLRYVRP